MYVRQEKREIKASKKFIKAIDENNFGKRRQELKRDKRGIKARAVKN